MAGSNYNLPEWALSPPGHTSMLVGPVPSESISVGAQIAPGQAPSAITDTVGTMHSWRWGDAPACNTSWCPGAGYSTY